MTPESDNSQPQSVAQHLLHARIVAIIRLRSKMNLMRIADILVDEGVRALEITLPTPGSLTAVAHLRTRFGDACLIGVGTVRRPEDVGVAADAGAQFLVTPTVNPKVLNQIRLLGLPVLCGAYTPTEIDMAWQAGATAVKVFPASIGGPPYIRELTAPFDDVAMFPTGGVTAEALGAYASAGAMGVGVGGALVSASIVDEGNWAQLRNRARTLAAASLDAWGNR